ncbi:pyridoxal phosphate-dependent decarboxylase family protein [Jannaschia seohaensis]|uniref:Aromatic-L-amino-acid decarboxylase n=1 Tax=Jannaschia seohaensis TaxID=475081 RepID=A0A2Y9AQ28_9RHOB|nr:pyridoxal-dependent decarboxylase [Jannaschia seohaensis]PWJ20461.1 aromatic-L-amino-acid decarboxylase [Jannaschia seohaensis]SSA44557.1 aromatic-L-amino-acid decarboxylase [Jannaschia seohaensis]
MNHDDLPAWSARAAEWIRAYHAGLRDRPVRAQVKPGDVLSALPPAAPETAEAPDRIFADFERLIPGALTHWQHPRFFAYFPANAAPASILAEQLIAGIGAQGMLWQTSPAATELEQAMIGWLIRATGFPEGWTGTIHDSATVATLCAVLTMREKALGFTGLTEGLSGAPRLRLYASAQTHSSVDKAARLAGIGQENLVKVPTRSDLSMDPDALAAAIEADLAAGHMPCGVIFCAGGTAVGAFDDIAACLPVARAHGLPTHVDAAWAGSALVCEELRPLMAGAADCDSIVFNPHKWMGAQFDCAVQLLRDPTDQIRTLGLRPDFLQTLEEDAVTDFNEWTVPLGRRMRALKLWFVLRAYGLDGVRTRLRNHVAWTRRLCESLRSEPSIDIVTEPRLSLFTFALSEGDAATEALLTRVNAEGRIYLTQTHHAGRFVIRFTCGTWDCTEADVMEVRDVLRAAIT